MHQHLLIEKDISTDSFQCCYATYMLQKKKLELGMRLGSISPLKKQNPDFACSTICTVK
jgi:hypothetical protein